MILLLSKSFFLRYLSLNSLFLCLEKTDPTRPRVFLEIHRKPPERKGPHYFSERACRSWKSTSLLFATGNIRRKRWYGRIGSTKRINRPIQGHGSSWEASEISEQEGHRTCEMIILRRRSLLHQYRWAATKPQSREEGKIEDCMGKHNHQGSPP